MKSVTLLCRGTSLGHIGKLPKVKHSVIVNAFHYEVENKDVHEYLTSCSKVTHILSLGAYFPQSGARELYTKYNFDKIVLPYIEEVSPPIPTVLSDILPVENLSDVNKKDMISTPRYKYTAPTSGMDALLYIVNELEPDEVNIIGLDFYDNTGYFTNSHGRVHGESPTDIAIRNGEPTDIMQNFFKNFVISKSNVIFNLYTTSDFTLDVDNIKIKKVIK
jgi:hypothetical protein